MEDKILKKSKPKGRSTSSKSFLFLSDMHVGSMYAVRSPDATLEDGSEVKQNEFQKQLYDIWCTMRDKCRKPVSEL